MIKMDKLTNASCLIRAFLFFSFFLYSWNVDAQEWSGPSALKIPVSQEAKPYTRWWWLGSATLRSLPRRVSVVWKSPRFMV